MFQRGFKQKIMLYLTLTIVVQVLWIAFIFTRDVTAYTDQYQQDIIESTVVAQIQLFSEWIEIQESIIRNYAIAFSGIASDSTQLDDLSNFVNVFESQEASFINVYYTSEDGVDVLSGGQAPKVDGRTREWYKGAKVESFYVSQPYIDALTNQFVVTLSIAVIDSKGKLLGVLGADLLLIDMFEKIDIVDKARIAGSFITDEKGQVIFYDGINDSDFKESLENPYQKIYSQFTKENESVKVHLGTLEADMVIFFKNDHALWHMSQYSQEFWISIVAGLSGLMIIVFYLSKTLSMPITRLSQNIKNLMKHSESLDISREKFDADLEEIIQLFLQLDTHINGNIQQINFMNDNMKEANIILEKKNDEFLKSLDELNAANSNLGNLERTYQNLINNIDDLIWIVDLEGKITYANTRFYELIGNSFSSEQPIYIRDFILEIQEAQDFSGVGFFSRRDFADLDLRVTLPKQNKLYDIQANTAIIYLKDNPISIQFICRDVTEEKKLYSQYYHKNKEMMILNDISRSLTIKEDLKSILQLITDRISTLLSVSAVSVRMLDGKDCLNIAAYSGIATNRIYPEVPTLYNTHMGMALREEKIISIKDEKDLLFEDTYLKSVIERQNMIYYFPLFNHENKFGVLTVIANEALEVDKIRLLKSLSENASTAIEKATLFERLRHNYLMTIEALSNALEEKVFNYKNHTKRVAEYSKRIAKRFYLSQKDLDDIYISGLLHDIGKLGISDGILNHEDVLSEEEEILMEQHVEVGKKIIEPIGLNQQIVDGIYLHHKNFDLTGYPENIELDRLPLFARIIGLADAFDSEMIAVKGNEPWKLELVYNHLEMSKDTLYCPEVMAALWELIKEDREQIIQISEI